MGGVGLFLPHVLNDRALQRRHDDVSIDRVLLAEPPASADGLVVRLVRVRQPDEAHLVGVLEVHPEPRDARFRDEHPDGSVLECFEGGGFGVGRP